MVMFFAAALLMWSTDPVLRSPEERLPIGAVARIGDARFARPVRSNETIVFSPDGTRIAFLNPTWGPGKVPDDWWDVRTLKRIPPPFRLKPDERISAITEAGIVCFSDREYTLRDAVTGAPRLTLSRAEDLPYFYSARFAVGGDLAMAQSENRHPVLFRKNRDGTIIAAPIKEILGTSSTVRLAANGSAIVWSTDDEIKRYEITTGRISTVRRLSLPFVNVDTLEISPDGRTILVVLRDRDYDLPPLCLLFRGEEPQPVTIAEPTKGADQVSYNRMRFSGDGRTLYSLNSVACCGWSSATGEWLWTYAARPIKDGALSPDGRLLVHQEFDGTFRLVDVVTGTERTPRVERFGNLQLASWIDSTSVMATTPGTPAEAIPGSLLRWNAIADTRPTATPLAAAGGWSAESMSPGGRFLGLAERGIGSKASFRIVDAASGESIADWESPTADKGFFGPFSPDGRQVVMRKDRQTALFAVSPLRPLVTLAWPPAEGRRRAGVEWLQGRQMLRSPDQRLLWTTQPENSIAAYELATGQLRYAFTILGSDPRREASSLTAMACSADGRRLVVEHQGRVMLVEPTTGRLERALEVGTRTRSESSPIALSPDGRWYATIRHDVMDLLVFDLEVEGMEPARVFRGATGVIQTLGFSPDGRFLLSTSNDGTALTWDMRPLLRSPRTPAGNVEIWWNDLGREASRANAAMQGLVAREPERAVAMMRSQWRPTAVVDPGRIANAVRDLDSNDYPTREEARRRLAEMGDQAEPWLTKAAKTARSAEVRMTARALLDDGEGPDRDPNRIRWRRAIEVLERIDSADSRALLKTIAAGPPTLRTTIEAAAALKRIARNRQPDSRPDATVDR
jgi:WD40 repeat protein